MGIDQARKLQGVLAISRCASLNLSLLTPMGVKSEKDMADAYLNRYFRRAPIARGGNILVLNKRTLAPSIV